MCPGWSNVGVNGLNCPRGEERLSTFALFSMNPAGTICGQAAGGQIQGGQNLDYRGKSDRQWCRLYLSMMDKTGVHLEKFGDATEPLAEV